MGVARGALFARLQRHLSAPNRRALRTAITMAEQRGESLYLVGGAVRDLLRDQTQLDLDLVTEGDVFALAEAVAAKLGARVVSHRRFGTATVANGDLRLDLARARRETYRRPGALPTVSQASLDEDLGRRDLTVNAMALRLTKPNAGELIDPLGGRNDLKRRRLHLLHEKSFQDDATRILRVLRYAGRLNFQLSPDTKALLQRDLRFLDSMSGTRLRNELSHVTREDRPAAILRLLARFGVLSAVHPALRVDTGVLRALRRLHSAPPAQRDAIFYAILLSGVRRARAEELIERLALTGRRAAAVRGLLTLRGAAARLAQPSLRVSTAAALFARQPIESIEAFAIWAGSPLAARRARRYLDEWRNVRPRLNGRDVLRLSGLRGPQIGAALSVLLKARLDGRTNSREDEEALLLNTAMRWQKRREQNRG